MNTKRIKALVDSLKALMEMKESLEDDNVEEKENIIDRLSTSAIEENSTELFSNTIILYLFTQMEKNNVKRTEGAYRFVGKSLEEAVILIKNIMNGENCELEVELSIEIKKKKGANYRVNPNLN